MNELQGEMTFFFLLLAVEKEKVKMHQRAKETGNEEGT